MFLFRYCNPTYAFPPQSEVIDFTVNLVQRELQRNPRTLIVCGSYTIGKERIFIGTDSFHMKFFFAQSYISCVFNLAVKLVNFPLWAMTISKQVLQKYSPFQLWIKGGLTNVYTINQGKKIIKITLAKFSIYWNLYIYCKVKTI